MITSPSSALITADAGEVNSMSYMYLPALTALDAVGESCNLTFPARASYIDTVKFVAVDDWYDLRKNPYPFDY